MNNNPFFSIILPIYNVEAYMERCIKSILNQDFSDYEIILVDDGSTDNCPKMCDAYLNREKFKVVHKTNGGLSSARNAGLEVASGRYVFFLDSDDYIDDNALRVLYDNLFENNVDVIKFNYRMQPSKNEVISSLKPGLYRGSEIRNNILPLALKNSGKFTMNAWSHIYSMNFLKKTGLIFTSEREVGSEDYLFNFEMFLRAESLMCIEDVLYNYDYREGSLTKRYRNKLISQYQKLYQLMVDIADRYNADEIIKKSLDRFYLWNCFYVVMGNENHITDLHTKKDRENNIKTILTQSEYIKVLRNASVNDEVGKRKIYLLFLKMNKYFITNALLNI